MRHVPRWTPPLRQAFRIALRPMLVYTAMTALGFVVFFFTLLRYDRSGELEFFTAAAGGLAGVVAGQLLALLRVRTWLLLSVAAAATLLGSWVMASGAFTIREMFGVAVLCFFFALPCGAVALQHHGELFAAFWPSVGWIGAIFTILNAEGRGGAWEVDKVSAWLPVPLFFLFSFIVLWLLFLASKQAMRVELWQALSGAAARRIERNATVSAVPKKNLGALLVVALLLFAITAVLAPYLWRTGPGNRAVERDRTEEVERDDSDDGARRRRSPIDGNRLARELMSAARHLRDAALVLWPLLLLFLAYRPTKRLLLLRHLRSPFVPVTPTERIENGWEYVRIAAGDAGVEQRGSDSVEELVGRLNARGIGGPGVDDAARIYTRTRYGLTVVKGDPEAMREAAGRAGRELRSGLGAWARVRNLWRPLE